MKLTKRLVRLVAAFGLLFAVVAMAAGLVIEETPGVPTVFNTRETPFQNQTHFLTFVQLGSPESADTAKAYYKAIDPGGTKATFQEWLVKAGFISDPTQWHPTGPQIIACDLGPQNGCDQPRTKPDGSTNYGDNIINADSHAIVLNAADLGFVRNQFVRCSPSCGATNAIIYTYLENYPVNPFATKASGGSGFPIFTGYPTQSEAAAAISSALNRPLGKLAGCNDSATDTALKCSIQRIADVAFEFTPAPLPGKNSAQLYGKLYAYIFSADTSGIGDQVHTRETITVPPAGFAPNLADGDPVHVVPNYSTGGLTPIGATDSFPPNLDFIGFKQHPGVCFICHGGAPQALVNGQYPNQGKVNGFRMLPLDIRNLMFTSDAGISGAGGDQPALNPDPATGFPGSVAYTDRLDQEEQIFVYNSAVMSTVNQTPENDGSGTVRVPHLAEVVQGWYLAGLTSNPPVIQQDDTFVPAGWVDASNGGPAPDGSQQVYEQVVAPFCRSCHFNREIALDFGTAANFRAEPDDIFVFAVRPFCQQSNPPNGKQVMPLAHLTYQRYWQANTAAGVTIGSGPSTINIANTVEQLAQYFGYASTADWCAKKN
jgi:hypothetical protein